jgi:tripartite-type tricarboxylate transporter receptor subunit TctC
MPFKTSLAAVLLAATAALPASAADVAEFYKSNPIKLVVGYTPGGGVDAYSRMLARHMSQYIPGNPSIIVSNMPGAGSQTAVRSMETNPRDGTYIVAFNTGNVTLSLIDPENMNYNFSKVAYLGSIGAETQVCAFWHTKGITTFDQLLKAPQLNIGATAPGTSAYMMGAVVRNLFGAKLKHVLGYPGRAEQMLAIEGGELDGDCGSWDGFPKAWTPEKKLNVVVKLSQTSPPDLPKTPYIGDYANDEQKQILKVILAINDIFRPYIVSKDTPPDRLKALQDAFMKTVTSKAFLDEAKQAGRTVDGPMSGPDVAKVVEDMYRSPPEIAKKAKAAIE